MLRIFNDRIYGIKESIIASGYPMIAKQIDEWDEIELSEKDYNRISKLGTVPSGTGHDNALKGIVVQFDVTYPVYWSPQFQRYNFADIVSSTSAMHRLHKMDLDEAMNEYVLYSFKQTLKGLIAAYNKGLESKAKDMFLVHPIGEDLVIDSYVDDSIKIDSNVYSIEQVTMHDLYMRILSNCPQGLLKTMRVTTNYLQLKTMYQQRKHHKLKEWKIFCSWCESLESFPEFCLKGVRSFTNETGQVLDVENNWK